MDTPLGKDLKEKANKCLMKAEETAKDIPKIGENTQQLLTEKFDNKSLQAIKEIYEKTENLKHAKKANDIEVQENFKNIKARLNQSSEYLSRIKKDLENINFSYSKNVLNMHNSLQPGDFFDPEKNPIRSKEEMERKMEEIRIRIGDFQKEIKEKKDKHTTVTKNFQEAFDDVIGRLHAIDKGEYRSVKPDTKPNETNDIE